MWQTLFKWTNAFVDLFRENKLLASKVVNILLVLMALIYIIFITKAIVQSNINSQEPLTIEKVTLLKTNIRVDQAIFVVIQGNVNITHCSTYVIGSVIDSGHNVLFDKITPLPPNQLDDALENKAPIKLNVGVLQPGSYTFRAEFHDICGGKSYIILAPLVSFEVTK